VVINSEEPIVKTPRRVILLRHRSSLRTSRSCWRRRLWPAVLLLRGMSGSESRRSPERWARSNPSPVSFRLTEQLHHRDRLHVRLQQLGSRIELLSSVSGAMAEHRRLDCVLTNTNLAAWEASPYMVAPPPSV